MHNPNYVLEVHDVSKNYVLGRHTVRALRNVSLRVRRESFTVFVGPSGSGKSTLLDIVGCLGRPSEGYITINGEDPAKLKDASLSAFRARHIGYVFQTFNLLEVLSAFENVEYPLLLLRIPAPERKRRVTEILDRVGLSDHTSHRPSELSGGQRQRVAVARALVARPKFVLADEPTANLDSQTGAAILDLMTELNRSLQTTFIFATHDDKVVARASEVLRLKDGVSESC
jgi:putative ABC transport system ATP-binding protein